MKRSFSGVFFILCSSFLILLSSLPGPQVLAIDRKAKKQLLLNLPPPKKYQSVADSWVGRSVGGTPMARVQHWVMPTQQGNAIVTEKFDIRGRAREQTLNFGDRTQTEIDSDGDGQLDEWTLTANDLRIQLHSPREGHFRFMEIRKETQKEWVDLLFIRTKKGHYSLINRSAERKFTLYNSQDSAPDDFVAGQCRETEEQLQSEVSEFNTSLTSGVVSEEKVDSLINDQILDASCNKPEFKNQKEKIAAAMKKVFLSDKDFSKEKQQSTSSKNKEIFSKEMKNQFEPDSKQPKFLGCLRRYQMDTHATRIASALQTKMHTNAWSWKVQCETALPKHSQKCGSIAMVPDLKKKETHQHISFIMHPAGSRDAELCNSSLEQTFFHEMLHYSGIQDEILVKNITNCCMNDNPQSRFCRPVRHAVQQKLAEQKMWNLVIDSLSPEDFQKMKLHCENLYGTDCDKNVKQVLKNASIAGSEIIKDQTKCAGGPAQNSECARLLKEEGVKQVKSIFNNNVCYTNGLRGISEFEPEEHAAKKIEIAEKCETFNEKIALIFSGNPDDSSIEKICSKRRSLQSNYFRQLQFLLTSQFAYGDQYGLDLCADMKSVDTVMNWSKMSTISDRQTPDERYRDRNTAREAMDALAGQVTVDPRQVAGGVKQVIEKQAPLTQHTVHKTERGPTRKTAFADASPGDRLQRINYEIRKQNDLGDRIQKFTSIPYESMIPSAYAKAGDKERLLEARTLTLPDPLSQNAGSNLDRDGLRGIEQLSQRRNESRPARAVASENEGSRNKESRNEASISEAKNSGTKERESGKNSSLPAVSADPGSLNSGKNAGSSSKIAANQKIARGSPPSNSKTEKILKKDDPRARSAFIKHLLSLKGDQVSDELKLDATQSLLFTHRVAVIDDNGEKHGPVQEALKWLIFNHDRQKLVQMTEN